MSTNLPKDSIIAIQCSLEMSLCSFMSQKLAWRKKAEN